MFFPTGYIYRLESQPIKSDGDMSGKEWSKILVLVIEYPCSCPTFQFIDDFDEKECLIVNQ